MQLKMIEAFGRNQRIKPPTRFPDEMLDSVLAFVDNRTLHDIKMLSKLTWKTFEKRIDDKLMLLRSKSMFRSQIKVGVNKSHKIHETHALEKRGDGFHVIRRRAKLSPSRGVYFIEDRYRLYIRRDLSMYIFNRNGNILDFCPQTSKINIFWKMYLGCEEF